MAVRFQMILRSVVVVTADKQPVCVCADDSHSQLAHYVYIYIHRLMMKGRQITRSLLHSRAEPVELGRRDLFDYLATAHRQFALNAVRGGVDLFALTFF